MIYGQTFALVCDCLSLAINTLVLDNAVSVARRSTGCPCGLELFHQFREFNYRA
jgi:hypothetical protein